MTTTEGGTMKDYCEGEIVRVVADEAGHTWRGIVDARLGRGWYRVNMGRDTQGRPKVEEYAAEELRPVAAPYQCLDCSFAGESKDDAWRHIRITGHRFYTLGNLPRTVR